MAEANRTAAVPKKPPVTHTNPLAKALYEKLDYDQLTNCMRCGFCLPACPTFRETGLEAASPRGRIALMKAAVDGLMEPDQAFREQMSLCIGCRACEPACPAGVRYGQLIEQTREAIEENAERGAAVKFLRRFVLRWLFPHRSRLKKLGTLLAFYQKSGFQRLARLSSVLKLFPPHLREMEKIMPPASGKGVVERVGTLYPARGEPIARVGLFRGCIMDVLFAETNVNTVKLLAEAGFEVVIPDEQACCGALHAHSGEANFAKELARKNLQAFQGAKVDYIVSNAGGCGALLIEYDQLLWEDEEYREQARWFSARVIDVSTLLLERGRLPEFAASPDGRNAPVKVTYQDSCHLRNLMKGGSAPRELIRRTANVEYVEMKEADRCCGSGGIYNLVQPEMAGSILEHKIEHAKRTEARYLLTSNPGCLLQMKVGIERHGLGGQMIVQHVVDFLHERIKDTKTHTHHGNGLQTTKTK